MVSCDAGEGGCLIEPQSRNGFIAVKDSEFYKQGNPHLGTELELNDNCGVVIGVAKVAASGLFGVPTLYTTYTRALQYIPNTRFTISYLLIGPNTEAGIPAIAGSRVPKSSLPNRGSISIRRRLLGRLKPLSLQDARLSLTLIKNAQLRRSATTV